MVRQLAIVTGVFAILTATPAILTWIVGSLLIGSCSILLLLMDWAILSVIGVIWFATGDKKKRIHFNLERN